MFITIFNPRSIPSKEHNDEKNGFGLSPALYYRDVRLRRHALDGPETGGQIQLRRLEQNPHQAGDGGLFGKERLFRRHR
jgi:hypothetical protein